MEKERYVINKEDCLIDTEANQYVCDFCELTIFPDIVVNLLNQQDARIKELESQLSLQKSKSELVAENEGMKDTIAVVLAQKRNTLKNNDELRKENQQLINQYDLLNKKYCEEMDKNIALIEQLKQSQNQKAIEELEKVKEWIKSVDESGYIFPFRDMDTREKFNQKLDNQIKELRSE